MQIAGYMVIVLDIIGIVGAGMVFAGKMKRFKDMFGAGNQPPWRGSRLAIFALLGLCMSSSVGAQVVQFEFDEAEGFADGNINNHPRWISYLEANAVDTSGTGCLVLDSDTRWVNSICVIGLSPVDSRLTTSADLVFTESVAFGRGDLFSLIAKHSVHTSLPDMRVALRRLDDFYLFFFKSMDGTQSFSPGVSKSALGLDGTLNDTSDELSLTMTLLRGEDQADWTVCTTLSNMTQFTEVLNHTNTSVVSSAEFFDASHLFFGMSSSMEEVYHGTTKRTVERFSMERRGINATAAGEGAGYRASKSGLPDQGSEGNKVKTTRSTASTSVVWTNTLISGAWDNELDAKTSAATSNLVSQQVIEWPAEKEIAFFDIPRTLNELYVLADGLRAEQNTLPVLNDTLQYEAYGYHGGYLPALEELPDEPRWTLDFSFNSNIALSRIILVPALDRRFGRPSSYGFPLRFRVLMVAADGSMNVVKEWMDADCPDPGRFPLIIDVPPPRSHIVRIEVFRGFKDEGRELFALDELFGVMGAADHPCLSMTASSEYESLPYWGKQFLIDRKTSLGLPLDVKSQDAINPMEGDFAVSFDAPPTNHCVVELDMGKNRKLGWVSLFPAQSSEGIMIPGFGFPENLAMDIVRETPDGKRGRVFRNPVEWEEMHPGNNVARLSGVDLSGRWIRIQADNLPLHNGKPTFAIGEIHVYRKETTYPIDQIHLEGFPPGADAKTELMKDGMAGGQPILFLLDWLHKIERRHQLSRSLLEFASLEDALRTRWKRSWQITGFSALLLLAMVAVLSAITAIVQRRRYAKRLRFQISSDLHDDVGALLGCSMLAGKKLERRVTDDKTLHEVRRILNSTTKATHALRDVVWISNDEQDTLRHLVAKLRETAEVYSEYYQLQFSDGNLSTLTDYPLSLASKRDTFLFVKEALNNIHKHAQAQKVELSLSQTGGRMRISIKDDGIGFNLNATDLEDTVGFGLRSMEKRAKHLGGRLTIHSAPGSGTEVVLAFPIRKARRVKLSGDSHG
ncbi:sensor histidine kinase [Pontiella sulfatireligans]|uniref:histidine kinase n=1 Tax=Pontiella sulfatireligans TaxID=2750658 RepID=A0A6C2UEW4_9BACT|nr:ATP-binding protein [Pontiella sulfatireligans]VGO18720.1 Sensor histidine kinase LiaS [Pontiella sulfatireligans]